MKETVLVIGGTGYIGQEVVSQLLEEDKYNVISLSLHKNTKCLSYVEDVSVYKNIARIYSKYKIKITFILFGLKLILKSSDVGTYAKNDLCGLINIMNACKEYSCKKIVYLSSSAIYESGKSISEKSNTVINSFYSYIKITSETLLRWYQKYESIEYVILRCFNVSGYSKISVKSNDLITLICEKKMIKIFGNDFNSSDGTLIRDYVHVSDVASAIVKAGDYKGSEIFNIGTGSGYSVLEVIKEVESFYNTIIGIEYGNRRNFDQDCLIADVSKSKQKLGWSAKYTLQDIIKSYSMFFST